MIPGFDLVQFSQTAGPLAALLLVAFIVFAESGLLIGFFLPGDSVLFTLGILIQGTNTFQLDLNIHLAIAVLFAAAVIGDNTGYSIGKKFGPRLFNRPDSLLFKQENVKKAQDFYNKYGGKTIIIARFVPIVRTFVPFIAGIAKMNHKTFFLFNIVGAAMWAAGVTYMGFFLGKFLHDLGIDVDTVLLPIIVVIVSASVAPGLYDILKDKNRRQIIWSTIKKQIFKK
ncbi:MAG: VTT domain-containing protein [Candidatus Saccharimonadales bacterium]